MKLRWLAALLFLLAVPASAQQTSLSLVSNYDLASTSYIYCVMTGLNGQAWAADISNNRRVGNASSSTNVAEKTVGQIPFALLTAGDEVTWNVAGVSTTRTVSAVNNSGADITINLAVDLSAQTAGYPFSWRKRVCSTAATAGWIPVNDAKKLTFQWDVTTLNATSADWRVECRVGGPQAGAVIVVPVVNLTAAGNQQVSIDVPETECRAGLKLNTDTGAQVMRMSLQVVR